MKTTAKKAAFIGLLVISAACSQAQLPPDSVPQPPPPPTQSLSGNRPPAPPDKSGFRGPRGERPMQNGLQPLVTVNGTVSDFTTNDQYVYDGFMLQANNHAINVRFATHMGDALMNAAKKGTTISVSGFYETTPENLNVFHLVSANASGIQLIDMPPVPPTTPPVPEAVDYTGKITELRHRSDGSPNGVLLDNKVAVNIPPHAMDQLQGTLQVGQRLQVAGFKTKPPTGVVMVRNITSIRPQTITMNNQTYLVR